MLFSFRRALVRRGWSALLPVMVAASTGAATPAPQDGAADGSCKCKDQYSVINLGPYASTALLNPKGQAAFSDQLAGPVSVRAFFDGRRLHELGSLGGLWTNVGGLNSDGVVVGESEDSLEFMSHFRAFSWSAAGGMRPLPGPPDFHSGARAINDAHEAVGQIDVAIIHGRAYRWNRDGSQTTLAPPAAHWSDAVAINGKGEAVGAVDDDSGYVRAMTWDAAGKARDLGALIGAYSYAMFINDRSQVAGMVYKDDGIEGFLWSAKAGLTPIRAAGGQAVWTRALNVHGEVAGDTENATGTLPFLWSSSRGLRLLPLGGAAQGSVAALNKQRQMVGSMARSADDAGSQRAVLWNGIAAPVDLNTRLYRPPAGLVLHEGAAINDNGVILARSNAGLVMLRPGRHGTPAPVLGPIAGGAADDTVELEQTVDFSVGFVDSSSTETHAATASVNDGCAASAPSLREVRGTGEVSLRHTFCQSGHYLIQVKLRDSTGHVSEVVREITVLDPAEPVLFGKGTLSYAGVQGQRGGRAPAPLRFTLQAPLGAPKLGNAARKTAHGFVSLSGPFRFHGEMHAAPARAGAALRLTGSGRLNGRPGYRFDIEATDEDSARGGADRLRVRISHTNAATKAEVVDYDNGSDGLAAKAGGAAGMRNSAALDRTLVQAGALRLTR